MTFFIETLKRAVRKTFLRRYANGLRSYAQRGENMIFSSFVKLVENMAYLLCTDTNLNSIYLDHGSWIMRMAVGPRDK